MLADSLQKLLIIALVLQSGIFLIKVLQLILINGNNMLILKSLINMILHNSILINFMVWDYFDLLLVDFLIVCIILGKTSYDLLRINKYYFIKSTLYRNIKNLEDKE
ncbi:MAG: hypothetical protein ACRC0X_09725 [Brevinema sp.]